MDIDFPLVLVILVFGSGLIWLEDHLLLAPKRWRALEQEVVVFPEPALLLRTLGSLGRPLGLGMDIAQREVADHVFQLSLVLGQQARIDLPEMLRAEGALVIGELQLPAE